MSIRCKTFIIKGYYIIISTHLSNTVMQSSNDIRRFQQRKKSQTTIKGSTQNRNFVIRQHSARLIHVKSTHVLFEKEPADEIDFITTPEESTTVKSVIRSLKSSSCMPITSVKYDQLHSGLQCTRTGRFTNVHLR